MDEIDPVTKQILLGIAEEQWLAYYDELVIYAEMRCRRWMWRTGNRENLPRGFSPDAVASEAITRLYDGRRKWNHDSYPGNNPVPFLKGVVDSIVSAIGRSSAHKLTASLEDEKTATGAEGESYEREVEAADGMPGFSPLAVLSPEQRAYFEEVDRRASEVIADRKDLVEYYRHACEGLSVPEIAAAMNIEVEAVRVLRRQFHRRTKQIQDELFGGR
jgi:DNA-directed RNA polymerase specialized sigma24 family protein